MKKILIGILIILLVVMAYFAIFKGISIGGFNVLSVEQIQDENNKLTEEIAKTETLMHSDYRAKTDELEKSVKSLLLAKNEYLDLAKVSTEGELSKASKQEVYKIEYLWTRIGSHATKEGVILKLDVTAGGTGETDVKNLSFTVTGNYIAVINFVMAVEDDSELGFRIENFKILPGASEDGRQATFMVRNVRVKEETANNNVQQNQNVDENNNQTNQDTNNTPQTDTTQTDTQGEDTTTQTPDENTTNVE